MSHFSTALAQSLQAADKTQSEVANGLGISQSLISRWANNKTDLREETLVRLLSQIPAEHHKMLIESYLLDRCPEQYRALISFAAADGVVREDAGTYTTAPVPMLPERTRRAIDTLARLCESNPPLRRMLTDLARLLTDPHAASAPADPEEESENKIHKQALEKYHETGGTWHPDGPTDSTHTSAG